MTLVDQGSTHRDAWETVAEIAAAWSRLRAIETAETGIGPMDHDDARLSGLARRMLAMLGDA